VQLKLTRDTRGLSLWGGDRCLRYMQRYNSDDIEFYDADCKDRAAASLPEVEDLLVDGGLLSSSLQPGEGVVLEISVVDSFKMESVGERRAEREY
jgi:hypothetical protein